MELLTAHLGPKRLITIQIEKVTKTITLPTITLPTYCIDLVPVNQWVEIDLIRKHAGFMCKLLLEL